MRISASIMEDFVVHVKISNETPSAKVAILYYGIIRAMKNHNEDAFMFAMNKFIGEEIDEMMGDNEDGKRKS